MRDIYEKFQSDSRPEQRRGRKRLASNELMDTLAVFRYERWLPWLQARKRRMGLRNSPTIDWWQGPPHERAARMLATWLRRNQSYRSVLNLVSRYR